MSAAWAVGVKSGRRPRLAQLGGLDQVRQGYRDGAIIAALAGERSVSRVAIRTAWPISFLDGPPRPQIPAVSGAPTP